MFEEPINWYSSELFQMLSQTCILPIDRTLIRTTRLGKSGPGGNCKRRMTLYFQDADNHYRTNLVLYSSSMNKFHPVFVKYELISGIFGYMELTVV